VLKKWQVSIPIFVVSPAIVLAIRPVKALEGFSFTTIALPVLMLAMLYFLAVMVFSKNAISIEDICISGFMASYISAAFASILFLRDSTGGAYTYLLIFIGAWITDIFAYFIGVLFGKHKLIPEISPKKTVEGSIGGTLFCGGAFVLYGVLIDRFVEEASTMNLFVLFAYGLVVAVVSQVGDLCMSAIKRRYGVKDFGKLFPGHGGMLDRFDSIIAVAVVLFVLNGFASVFN
jgi:phosphatidate cytidylyltransferase